MLGASSFARNILAQQYLTSLYLEQIAKRRFDLLHFVEQKLQLPRRVRVPKSTHRAAPNCTSESLLHSRGCAVHSTAAEQSERHSRKCYSMEDAANLKPREISCSEEAGLEFHSFAV